MSTCNSRDLFDKLSIGITRRNFIMITSRAQRGKGELYVGVQINGEAHFL